MSGGAASGRPTVLVIAGSDSSGGAGLTRDVRVLSRLGVEALCAVTAVTAQSDRRVAAVHHVPPEVIREQIASAFATRTPDAIKIGMLGSRAAVEAVAEELLARPDVPLVLDPVLAASCGGALLDERGRMALKERLVPRATLVTPNRPEAALLLDAQPAVDEAALAMQARDLLALGAHAVLLKGGHAAGEEAVDWLVTPERAPQRLAAPRVRAVLRGTGCALASAIAGWLAHGAMLADACRRGKDLVSAELRAAARDH